MNNPMIQCLEYARRALVKPRLEVAQLQLLLLIASQKEPKNMGELAKLLQVDSSFISRNAKAFGHTASGPQVLSLSIDPMSPKFRHVNLTDQGRNILATIEDIAAGSQPPKLPPALDARRRS